MGNSTSLGLGGSETHDRRDMVDDGIKDGGRPPEVVEEKPLEEPSNQNPPHYYCYYYCRFVLFWQVRCSGRL